MRTLRQAQRRPKQRRHLQLVRSHRCAARLHRFVGVIAGTRGSGRFRKTWFVAASSNLPPLEVSGDSVDKPENLGVDLGLRRTPSTTAANSNARPTAQVAERRHASRGPSRRSVHCRRASMLRWWRSGIMCGHRCLNIHEMFKQQMWRAIDGCAITMWECSPVLNR